MGLTVLTGGARSGKSTLALRRAQALGGDVVFIATAEPGDDEMTERIARHRAERDPRWETVEERIELAAAIERAPAGATVVVDCLSIWVANLCTRGVPDDAIERLAGETARLAAQRDAPVIAVTNEVGMGVVPASELGRRFRDLLGRTNAIWAAEADEAILVVAGRALHLEAAEGG